MKLIIPATLLTLLWAAPAQAGPCSATAAPSVQSWSQSSPSQLTANIRLTNNRNITLVFNYNGADWALTSQTGNPGNCGAQVNTFSGYTLSILNAATCTASPIYTPAEQAALASYVAGVGDACEYYLCPNAVCDATETCSSCPMDCGTCPPPPPPPTCDAAVAPEILSVNPDLPFNFWVSVELTNGELINLLFEHDGGWELTQTTGTPGICDGQLDTFTDYSLSILNSPSCAADQVYTPAEEAEIAWYVFDLENFCQDTQPPPCSPVETLALTAVDASSIPLTPNGCASQSWCELEMLRAWTIPACLASEPTTSEVVDLVLTEDQENSSLPWGTFVDRSGLSSSTFLGGTSGASLFNSIDAFTGSTYVEGWYFAVPVPCHNCTQYDVKTVIFYRNTNYVIALDGFYGWDS